MLKFSDRLARAEALVKELEDVLRKSDDMLRKAKRELAAIRAEAVKTFTVAHLDYPEGVGGVVRVERADPDEGHWKGRPNARLILDIGGRNYLPLDGLYVKEVR